MPSQATLLSWDGTHGRALHMGLSCPLTSPPSLQGVHLVVYLHYAPSTHAAEVRESAGATRPLTVSEVDEIRAFLDGMAAVWHGYVSKHTRHASETLAAEPGSLCVPAWRELNDATARLKERHRLVACMHRHGLPYEQIHDLLHRLAEDGAAAISMALAAARRPPAAPATPQTPKG